ncbi:MAG: DUF6597 domain-containing transcriptional factor [Planctomycetota bacterium]|jgi:methylphosphotriester-DNA--protein-cysteine methyltransferase
MQYREYKPGAGLSRQIRCLWTLSGSSGPSAEVEAVVPDGCAELLINRAAPFEQLLQNGAAQRQGSILIAGQISKLLQIRATGEVDLIGVRFQPGGLAQLLPRHSLADFSDRRIDLTDLDPFLAEEIQTAAHADAGYLQRTEAVLFRHLSRGSEKLSLAEEASRRIEAKSGQTDVQSLSTELGVSERGLQRAFHREVGIGPKMFARIIRFQTFLQAAESKTPWSRLALDCGYFDQSHVHRDCKRFTGKSPRAFLAEGHLLNDFISGRQG